MNGRRDNNDSRSVLACKYKRGENQQERLAIYMGGKVTSKVREPATFSRNKVSTHLLKKKNAEERRKICAPPMQTTHQKLFLSPTTVS